ncbi:NADP+ dependend succinate-semialdehyde dehydrogenase GabD (plasmid) [Cupriavidus necator N-1]|uniref:NADP+ dependend succinate-semialdehyde dehydrogenase GabD n=1 Tax=Cupriavidus necator (strain ATCC 43291 / DSM 13513 / CCUG 52238 / LMG 8453 / N-1) TaxID=1042878 RepID=F8GVE0_CUPNN|nr:NAD-dependent succinate-semialdehyde dehydrogenase [Cupriavidus necator]AEI81499.1 NADP+ dependend succinate-semialdehyde dehydrogenase GabD [Cupriavidus necator N-1]MDX6007874.1 NAD-dependent succinate-semialdehyde dehydrogenase [Cupriavidus necator]
MSFTLIRSDLVRSQVLIDGKWSQAETTFEVSDPASGEVITHVPDCTPALARSAVDAAEAALPAWRQTSAKARTKVLKRWRRLVLDNVHDLARIISSEQGKPLLEATAEIEYAASYIEWFAEQGPRLNGHLIPSPISSRQLQVRREPVGVVAVITPWNFPAAMIARKIATALAAGCTVVCKPAEDTPLTSLALLAEAGAPAGVANIVTASRARTPELVSAWLEDFRVRKISFTGSTAVGKLLAQRSAATLKRLSLELGGNAPFIVFPDADLDAAVEGLIAAKLRNGGQTCVSPNRVFVHNDVIDAFTTKLVKRVSALKVGPAEDPASQIGPMINQGAVRKIDEHVSDAISRGARLLAGGRRLEEIGRNFYAPTVLADVDDTMMFSREETFGPVVPVTQFATESEVIRLANDTAYGLAGYFYSRDVGTVHRVADALEVGIVGVNEGAIGSEAAPFGGVKESGYGREGSVWGLDDYVNVKYVCIGGLQ